MSKKYLLLLVGVVVIVLGVMAIRMFGNVLTKYEDAPMGTWAGNWRDVGGIHYVIIK